MISSLAPDDDGSLLNRRTSGDQAALYIRKLIFDGALKPGARLPQDEIAEALKISRIPLREGLIGLQREGWLTIEIHRGVYVNAIDAESVADHFEMLGLLYVFAIERAVDRWDETNIARLEEIQAHLESTTNAAEAGRHLLALFVALVDAACSSRLKVNLRAISSLVPGDFFSAVPDAIEVEKQAWAVVVAALRAKDARVAAEGFLGMMRTVSAEVQQLFAERGLFDIEPTR